MLGGGGERIGQRYADHQIVAEVVILGLGSIEGGGVGSGALLLGQTPVDGRLVGLAGPVLLVAEPIVELLVDHHGRLAERQ